MNPRSRQVQRRHGDLPARVLMIACCQLALASCSGTRDNPSQAARKQEQLLVGVIKGVRDNDFVVFKRTAGWVPKTGEILEWRPESLAGEGGRLKRSPERRGALFVADILSGHPETGDLIYYQGAPVTPDEGAATATTPTDSGSQSADISETGMLLPGEGTSLHPAPNLPALQPSPEERQNTISKPATQTSIMENSGGETPSRAGIPEAVVPAPLQGQDLPPLRPPPD